jgi:hypothetical protein
LRVYEFAEERLTVVGLGYLEPWTLARVEGHSTLAADVVGRWENEDGATIELTAKGVLLREGKETGRYEALSETTLWVSEGEDKTAWIVTKLSAKEMAYVTLGFYWDDPSVLTRLE